MKSQLFASVFDDPESKAAKAFARHLSQTLALQQDDLEACLATLPKFRLARSTKEQEQLIDELAGAREVERSKLEHAVGVTFYLLNVLVRKEVPESDASLWANDLADLELLDDSTRPVFETIVDRIVSNILPDIKPEIRRRQSATGILPAFEGAGITVEIRPVREGFYRRGTSLAKYEPQIVDTTIVASMHLATDVGEPSDFYFQADEDDIEYLINLLGAAKKDMAALRAYLNIDG